MNFFERQDKAKKQTWLLVFLFSLAVITIVSIIDLIALLIFGHFETYTQTVQGQAPDYNLIRLITQNYGLIVICSLVTLAVIFLGSLKKIAALSSGGGIVARSLGGELVATNVTDPKLRRLRNVIEEIALAAGIPVPEIYVLKNEQGINAFAAGFNTGDAAIAVTQGCLDQLNRDELQGIIAHEFSHILNGDMRLNIKLIGILNGILLLTIAGQFLLRGSFYGSRKNGGGIAVAGLALIIIGYAGVFFGRLIKAAVSRQREFLADASAVQFTRQAEGIGNALKKIAGFSYQGKIRSPNAEEVSHMLFAENTSAFLFATHPPLEKRIKALDPRFNLKRFLREQSKKDWSSQSSEQTQPIEASSEQSKFNNLTDGLIEALPAIAITPALILQQIGNPSTKHIQYAVKLRQQLPGPLIEATQSQQKVHALMFALLIEKKSLVIEKQLNIIKQQYDESLVVELEKLQAKTKKLSLLHRLPLLEMAFPALKQNDSEQIKKLLETVKKIAHADNNIDVFEYALSTLLNVYLTETLEPNKTQKIVKLSQLMSEIQAVFSIMAKKGHDNEQEAKQAYSHGIRQLFPMNFPQYKNVLDWMVQLDQSLPKLDALGNMDKQLFIESLVMVLSFDNKINLHEAELLRVICAVIHCPCPPILIETEN